MSDELARALRELAEQHQSAPLVGPARIRARAQRRGRRRRAVLVLGGTAVAACALTVAAALAPPAEDTGTRAGSTPRPATTAPATTSAPVPLSSPATGAASGPVTGSATVDLLDMSHGTLTVGDRVMRVDRQSATGLSAGHALTVTAKYDVLPSSASTRTGRSGIAVPFVVELRTADGSPVYVGALPAQARTAPGWVGLTGADARWFYSGVREGDQVRVVASVASHAGPGAAATDGPAVDGD